MNNRLRMVRSAWAGLLLFVLVVPAASGQTVARLWDEALLDAIRIDFPAPTVHSRNLYHTSAAMYDAWATYDAVAGGHFFTDKQSVDGINVSQARNEAISYAAYRVLSERYQHAVDPAASQAIFDGLMNDLGYDPNMTTTVGDSPAAVGNRIANLILSNSLADGSNEANGYVDTTGYAPVNVPMVVDFPGLVTPDAPPLADPNRWQPLFLNSAVTQNELEGDDLQTFVGPHWGSVTTFAMNSATGPYSWSEIDPGQPPLLNGAGDAEYRQSAVQLIRYSSWLDPSQGAGAEMINISPSVNGNRPLGTHDNQGYSVNPVTGQPYAQNMVKSADYGRILAEFWADGPNSETPPGHWNVLANEVADSGLLDRKIGGEGRTVGALEWDVKMYLALNGAVHDAAIAAWGAKAEYDYVRPITMIRYQGSLGQSSNPNGPSYHPDGLPLEEDLIEVITADSIAQGGRHRNAYINANRDADGRFVEYYSESELVGKIVIQSWNHEPADPDNQVSGVKWILAENWVPYQADNFVTPAFAAYVSGHSTFSRAAAEVLAHFTGSEYFPGGVSEQTFDVDYLDFEDGPTSEVTLQWATYYDAADEAGISRLWGGIHVPADDFAGRIMGAEIGIEAYEKATDEFVWDGLNWCNEVYTRDINNDGFVSPIDAQIVLNELDRPAYSSDGVLPDNSGKIPPYFFDVNDDGFVVPLDALLVINRLNEAAANNGVFAISSVPEPSSVVLLSIAVLTLISRGRRTLN